MKELKIILKTFSNYFNSISEANVWNEILYIHSNWCGNDEAFALEIDERFEKGKYPFN